MKVRKNDAKAVAEKRIEYLFNLLGDDKNVPDEDVIDQIEKLSVRFDITLPQRIKRSYCKTCKNPYRNNCRIRLKKGKVLVTCLKCGTIRRFDINQ